MKFFSVIDDFDKKLFFLLKAYSRKIWFMKTMRIISIPFSGLFCFSICAVIFFLNSKAPFLPILLSAECVQFALIIPLRTLIKRPRPRPAKEREYFWRWNSYSFPSLHSSRAAMLVTVLIAIQSSDIDNALPGVAAVSAGCPVAVMTSRLFLQKHYLSDVLCGSLIGTIAAASAIYLNL